MLLLLNGLRHNWKLCVILTVDNFIIDRFITRRIILLCGAVAMTLRYAAATR